MLLDSGKFVSSMNSVVLMVNNVATRLTTISFDDFLQRNAKKLPYLYNPYYNVIL